MFLIPLNIPVPFTTLLEAFRTFHAKKLLKTVMQKNMNKYEQIDEKGSKNPSKINEKSVKNPCVLLDLSQNDFLVPLARPRGRLLEPIGGHGI